MMPRQHSPATKKVCDTFKVEEDTAKKEKLTGIVVEMKARRCEWLILACIASEKTSAQKRKKAKTIRGLLKRPADAWTKYVHPCLQKAAGKLEEEEVPR